MHLDGYFILPFFGSMFSLFQNNLNAGRIFQQHTQTHLTEIEVCACFGDYTQSTIQRDFELI